MKTDTIFDLKQNTREWILLLQKNPNKTTKTNKQKAQARRKLSALALKNLKYIIWDPAEYSLWHPVTALETFVHPTMTNAMYFKS